MIKAMLLAMVLILMSACAVMDISNMDTAVPLRPDKSFDLAIYTGNGLDLSTAVNIEDDIETEDDPFEATYPVAGYKLNIGINPKLDLTGRWFIGNMSWGAKFGVKNLLWHEGKRYFAIQPSFTYLEGVGAEDSEWFNNDREYMSYGLENQFLFTVQPSKNFSCTLAARGNYNRLRMTLEDEGETYYNVFHGGVRGNLRLSLGPLYIVPEAGYEIVPIVHGDLRAMPVFCFAAGLSF
ncbi:MAG TPA: hypothetical protein PL188_10720 [Candidatus Cloacimonadota bacterium]|nr:hypothetical protein [Candidatus Cloacimonadota bacterium]